VLPARFGKRLIFAAACFVSVNDVMERVVGRKTGRLAGLRVLKSVQANG